MDSLPGITFFSEVSSGMLLGTILNGMSFLEEILQPIENYQKK